MKLIKTQTINWLHFLESSPHALMLSFTDANVEFLPYGDQVQVVCRNNQLTGFHSFDTQHAYSFLPRGSRKFTRIYFIRLVFKIPETEVSNRCGKILNRFK